MFMKTAAILPIEERPLISLGKAWMLPLTLWAGATCAWWMNVPALLGIELRAPVLVLGLAIALPVLVLRLAFGAAEITQPAQPDGEAHLGYGTFLVLVTAALLCPAPVLHYALDLPAATSLALLFVSHLGTLALAVLALPLLLVSLARPA